MQQRAYFFAEMEAILSLLPNLTMEELKALIHKITPKLYFDRKEYENDQDLPTNATTLMTDGTIEVLETSDDPDAWLCYEEGCAKDVQS